MIQKNLIKYLTLFSLAGCVVGQRLSPEQPQYRHEYSFVIVPVDGEQRACLSEKDMKMLAIELKECRGSR